MSVELLDCTLRDGGYLNDWGFSQSFAASLVRVLDESRVDYVEIGFWSPGKEHPRPWRACSLETINEIRRLRKRVKVCLLIDFGSVALADFSEELKGCVDLLRIACHKKDLEKAADFAAELGRKGFPVTINAMGITAYGPSDMLRLGKVASEQGQLLKYLYVADSFGALTPRGATQLFSFLKQVANCKLGYHPHNNLELAVGNTLAAIDAGASIVDASLRGLGRGGGNLKTEIIAEVLNLGHGCEFNPLPLISLADAAEDVLGGLEHGGYHIEQIISGLAKCHPNYASRLSETGRLSAEEIFEIIDGLEPELRARFSAEELDKAIAGFDKSGARRLGTEGVSPSVLKEVSASDNCVLICPGTDESELCGHNPQQDVSAGTPVFAVNFVPNGLTVAGALFGSLRRLWQYGRDVDESRCFLLKTRHGIESAPNARVLDVSKVHLALGKPLENSGALALAVLLESGFRHIDVFGMKGYSFGDTPNSDSDLHARMDEDALMELKRVKSHFAEQGRSFKLHGPTVYSGINS